MNIFNAYREFLSRYISFLDKYAPLWIWNIIQSIVFILLGFFLGAFITPVLLIIFTVFPFYLLYHYLIIEGRYYDALKQSFIWTATIALSIILLTIYFPDYAAKAIINGERYREEMFTWIRTGIGAESNPSQFIPIHITHYSIFIVTCLVSMSLIGIIFGAYLMNYMDYYVGMLFLHISNPTFINYLTISLIAWPIWAIIRVIGYLYTGTALAIPLTAKIYGQSFPKEIFKKYIIIGLSLIILDMILKAILAPIYQQIFHAIIAA